MAMEMDDIGAVGPYGMPMRFNVAEGMMAIMNMGVPYSFASHKARTRSVYVNKNLIGMYRGVGMPLACVATELLTGCDRALGVPRPRRRARPDRAPGRRVACVTASGQ